jgi:hypothetical protein
MIIIKINLCMMIYPSSHALFLIKWSNTWVILISIMMCKFTLSCRLNLMYIYYVPRTSRSEFVVSVNKYLEAKKQNLSVGMRFKMRFEGDEAPERRYNLEFLSA